MDAAIQPGAIVIVTEVTTITTATMLYSNVEIYFAFLAIFVNMESALYHL